VGLGLAGLVPFAFYAYQHDKTGERVKSANRFLALLDSSTGGGTIFSTLFSVKDAEQAQRRFLGYGATILSFLGGLHWGAALSKPAPPRAPLMFAWSVVPSLVAWSSLSRTDYSEALLIMAGGFAAAPIADALFLFPSSPVWFTRLRSVLTTGVLVCHGFAFFSSLPDRE
jgi:hypothetical protein